MSVANCKRREHVDTLIQSSNNKRIRYGTTAGSKFRGPAQSQRRGLSKNIRNQYSSIYIPMQSKGRSLNLANAVSIVVYEGLRQLN